MHDIIRHLFKNKIICVSYDKKMTLHKDSTNLDVAIIYHLCQEKNLSDSPKFLGRLRLKQILGRANRNKETISRQGMYAEGQQKNLCV